MTARRTAPASQLRPMTVAGIMSGTSADGIDVALVRVTPSRGTASQVPWLRLLAHIAVPYSAAVRKRVLRAMDGKGESVAELSQLNWRLGHLYAEAVESALHHHPARLDLIGCHGQTLYHQAAPQSFLGGKVTCTWQTGEPAVLAARLRVPVVSDFRPADLAAGGQGAPLVPLLDFVAFRHARRHRVLQNLGGIGNLTIIPAGARPRDAVAFDTGPANMVIDALMTECFHKPLDRDGAVAARGRVLEEVLPPFLSDPFFRQPPPKSAGREQFGRDFTARFLAACRIHSKRNQDAVATATALTTRSIGLAWKNVVLPKLRRSSARSPVDCIVSGGGAFNPTMMAMLQAELATLGNIRVETSDAYGMPAAAKEAMAFALLAWQTWHRLPGNLPMATGAEQPVILGKVSYA